MLLFPFDNMLKRGAGAAVFGLVLAACGTMPTDGVDEGRFPRARREPRLVSRWSEAPLFWTWRSAGIRFRSREGDLMPDADAPSTPRRPAGPWKVGLVTAGMGAWRLAAEDYWGAAFFAVMGLSVVIEPGTSPWRKNARRLMTVTFFGLVAGGIWRQAGEERTFWQNSIWAVLTMAVAIGGSMLWVRWREGATGGPVPKP